MAIMDTTMGGGIDLLMDAMRKQLLAEVREAIRKEVDPILERAARGIVDSLVLNIDRYDGYNNAMEFRDMRIQVRINDKPVYEVKTKAVVVDTTERERSVRDAT